MANDIQAYLGELQTALVSAGADPALVQDALFDAEEHLQSEMAAGGDFAAVAEGYGSPEEVAAAYLGVTSSPDKAATGESTRPGVVEAAKTEEESPEAAMEAAPEAAAASADAQPEPSCPDCGAIIESRQAFCRTCGVRLALPPVQPAQSPPPALPQYLQAPLPTGVQYGMQSAAAGASPQKGVLAQIFAPFADGKVWTSLLYMILSLATGIAYFTIVVTGLSVSAGVSVLIIGIPLLLLVLAIVRGISLFEGRLVEALLGSRMPRRSRPTPPSLGFWGRILFWLKDARTWASMVYMVLMLPLGITYFTFAVVGISVGLSLVTAPIWGWFQFYWGDHVAVINGVRYDFWPLWSIPIAFVAGVVVLIGFMHAVKWIGRGHAAFAKAMLVRLK